MADRSSDASKHSMRPKPRFIHVEKDAEVNIRVLSNLLPRAKGKQWISASLQMRILGGSQDPSLHVIMSVEDPDPNVLGPESIHVAEVIFPRSAIKDLSLLKSTGDSVEEGP